MIPIAAAEYPSRKARYRLLALGGLVTLLFALVAATRVNPLDALSQGQHLENLARDMFPPRLSLLWEREGIWRSVVETLAMAFVGTSMGLFVALPAGLLGAANTTPHPAVRALVRSLLSLERAITSFFFLLVMLIAFGLGPFAGTMTLVIGTLGVFGKLFAESIERVDSGPVEAIAAVGATRWQQIVFGVLPQAAPALIANSLFSFDVNLRLSIALGIFGAGGLGSELMLANNMLRYKDVLALALITMVLVTAFERISDYLRRKI
jgi:phosphonate transport system permease protein